MAGSVPCTDEERADTGFFARLFGRLEGHRSHESLYSEAARRGACVVVVDGIGEDRVDEAVEILERHGAFDIDERASQWRAQGWTGGEPVMAAQPSAQMQARSESRTQVGGGEATRRAQAGDTQSTAIPVVEEQLEVGKREVQRGGVRVYARTSERPVEETVTLREEHARVERRPVDREASEDELGRAFEEKSVELRETAEEPVVAKTARVVEEVEVGKDVSERTQTVRDTVRRRDVEVEQLPAGEVATGSQPDSGQATASSRAAQQRGKADVDGINRLLRDELSAIETYRQTLDRNRSQYGKDPRFAQLTQLLHDHEQHASQLRDIIRQVGGNESNDSGAWGTWANTVMGTAKLFGDKAALKALKEGEESGLQDYQDALRDDDVAGDARNVLASIVSKQQEHIRVLDRMMDAT
jgi:uncharacterized protein (TIGR02271 family)